MSKDRSETGDAPAAVPVSAFLERARAQLSLEMVAGTSGLGRLIPEATVNRPGLALYGFFSHFARRRIQVLGLAEHAYLSSLPVADRVQRLRAFFAKRVPCVILTRQRRIFPEIYELAEEFRVPVMRTRQITKHVINTATIIMENLAAPRANIQGTMVEIMGIGVLIEGKPGMGKSETALGLVKKGYALVSDDITAMRRDTGGGIIGSPVSVTRYHMEIRGLGIIHVPSLFGVAAVRHEKRLDLVATLVDAQALENSERDGMNRPQRTILGVSLPQVLIGVAPGRDLVNLVETAALDYKLRFLGHDAAKELDERIISLLSGARNASE